MRKLKLLSCFFLSVVLWAGAVTADAACTTSSINARWHVYMSSNIDGNLALRHIVTNTSGVVAFAANEAFEYTGSYGLFMYDILDGDLNVGTQCNVSGSWGTDDPSLSFWIIRNARMSPDHNVISGIIQRDRPGTSHIYTFTAIRQ